MSLDADLIVDRRRMRRKLTFWRVIAVLLVIGAVVGVGMFAINRTGGGLAEASGAYIARVKITGLIRNDMDRTEALDNLSKSRARAVIVHIDSPGGTTAGSEQLYDSLRAVAAKKPTVIVVDGLAASGGYIAAMAGDHIIAQSSSIVGSIGVLFQYPNVSDLMKTIGIKIEEVKSSPLKAAPNGFEPTSPEARAAIEALIKDSYAWFRGLVRERRQLDGEALERVADGRVFTGRQGIELKLVDAIGNEKTALEYLKGRGINPETPVRDWRLSPRFRDFSVLHMAAVVLDGMGMSTLARVLDSSATMQTVERLNLDGLLAVWHPSLAN